MSLIEQNLLKELLTSLTTSHVPSLDDSWSTRLDESLSNWIVGQPGSMSLPRLANALRAKADPHSAAEWWERMLQLEESGKVVASMPGDTDSITHRLGFFQGCEPASGTSWGSSLIGEAASFQLLSPCPAFESTCQLLRRSIRRHIGLASLFATYDLIIRGPCQQVIYRGPAVLSPGARTKGATASNYRPINAVFAYAIGHRPSRCRFDRVTKLASYAIHPEAWPITENERVAIHHLVGIRSATSSQLVESANFIVDNLLPSTRLAAPFEIRYYPHRVVSWMSANPNSVAPATYYSNVANQPMTEGSSVVYLYPYGGSSRIRSKDLIGEGSLRLATRSRGTFAVCENLRLDEVAERKSKKGRPKRNVVKAKLPSKEAPIFKVTVSRDVDLSLRPLLPIADSHTSLGSGGATLTDTAVPTT